MSQCFNFRILCIVMLLTVLYSSCKIYPPSLKSLDKLNIQRSGSTGFTAGTEAVIHNPNRVRIKLRDLNLVASINGKPLATIGKTNPVLIKGRADFTIPIVIEVASLESVFSDFKSLMSLLSKEVDLEVKGNVKLRAFGFLNRKFPLQYRQKVLLPQFK
jgi:hypothetical protein